MILQENYPPMSVVLTYSYSRKKLWAMRSTDDDFLLLRVGTGRVPLKSEIQYPKERFQMDEDALENKMREVAGKPVFLENTPILLDLKKNFIIGLTGAHKSSVAFAIMMIVRLSVLYSYDELKMIFLLEPDDLNEIEFVRYLPHTWDNKKTIRFIATDISGAYQIGEYLGRELEKDLENPRDIEKIVKDRPWYIVFAFSKTLFDSVELFKSVMRQKKAVGVSVVSIYNKVPKESFALIKAVGAGQHMLDYVTDPDQMDIAFKEDAFSAEKARQCVHEISNISLETTEEGFLIPKSVGFLEMYGVGRVEHLNAARRWEESDPVKTLAAPVGIGSDGDLFSLDLHQKFQGPHGLVAGMTGSGKSEFLITYILSMALNYHPDDVAFVLIDYKGGGLAGAFDDPERGIHLPHLVGTITNLDGASINRSLISIQSELKRRQRVFNKARTVSGESTIDIYTYQRLYHGRVVREAVPHLFIISDEFAELKAQQPEFMDQLVSAARIGRSLGVHLILATQKPSGVVNDQIRSNTKFQVCLKVQDRSDSMDMIRRPDAAELKETGRFYIQVGYNEYFAMGQSAWSGADYIPQDEVIVKRDNSIEVIDVSGQKIYEKGPEQKIAKVSGSQLSAVVKYLSKVAKDNKIPVRTLWKPELPDQLDLDYLQAEYGCSNKAEGLGKVFVGMVDDPENQKQFPFDIDLLANGHLLIAGEGGSGKSSLVQTLTMALADKYSPEEVNFYLVDYSGNTSGEFRNLPHCGGVFNEEQDQFMQSLINLIGNIVQKRKKTFEKYHVDSFLTARKEEAMPLIIIMIDNVAAVAEEKGGQLLYANLENILKEVTAYGIRFVISVSHMNELSMRIKQELPYRISLQQKDKYDYSDVLGCRCSYIPKNMPGRGLAVINSRPLEIQIAMYGAHLNEKDRTLSIGKKIQDITLENKDCKEAEKLANVSQDETYAIFSSRFEKGRIPIGYALDSGKAVALPFRQFSVLTLYFGKPEMAEKLALNLETALNREQAEIYLLGGGKVFQNVFSKKNIVKQYDISSEGLDLYIKDIIHILQKRIDLLKDYSLEKGLGFSISEPPTEGVRHLQDVTQPIFIVVTDFAKVCGLESTVGDTINKFGSVITLAGITNLFLVACFTPEDNPTYQNSQIYKKHISSSSKILLSGEFDKQNLVHIPYQISGKREFNFNSGFMHYRQKIYEIMVPVGKITEELIDEDERSIFE